jgi:hypothetical protein
MKRRQRSDYDISDSSDSASSMDIDDNGTLATYNSSTPSLQKYYYGPALLAYPPSLAIFSKPGNNWYWNATASLSNRPLDPIEVAQISSQLCQRGFTTTSSTLPALQLGTSEDMITCSTPRFSTFLVFPHADPEVVRCDEFQRVWTDSIMIPSVLHAARKREGFTYGIPQYARSHRSIHKTSECQRIVSPHSDAPSTPMSVKLRGDELDELWRSMQTAVRNQPNIWEFQDMFLVVVAGQDSETGMQCYGSDLRSFWGHFNMKFDRALNMESVPPEDVTISPKVWYSGLECME